MYGRTGHRPARQEWEVGAKVNVGFLRDLTITEREPTPGDWQPDAWLLQAPNGTRYRFVPHIGIERL